jgi:hypothetical protein
LLTVVQKVVERIVTRATKGSWFGDKNIPGWNRGVCLADARVLVFICLVWTNG